MNVIFLLPSSDLEQGRRPHSYRCQLNHGDCDWVGELRENSFSKNPIAWAHYVPTNAHKNNSYKVSNFRFCHIHFLFSFPVPIFLLWSILCDDSSHSVFNVHRLSINFLTIYFTGVLNTFVFAGSCQDSMARYYLTPDIQWEYIMNYPNVIVWFLGWFWWWLNTKDFSVTWSIVQTNSINSILYFMTGTTSAIMQNTAVHVQSQSACQDTVPSLVQTFTTLLLEDSSPLQF